MRVTRLFHDGPLAGGGQAELGGEAAAHARRVLRLEPGDRVVLFNGDGWDYPGVLGPPRGGQLPVVLGERQAAVAESPLELTLVQGVSRGDRMDLVLQKATELGVARIVPVLAERSVVRLDGAQAARKLAHWRGIVIAACGQCGRARLPQLEPPRPLGDWLATPAAAGVARFLLAVGAPQPLARAAAGVRAAELLIGPEGGLASGEQAAAMRAGFVPTALGPRVLRTETAAIAALTVLQASAGDLGNGAG